MNLLDPIVQFHAELVQVRRDIHAHPELCYEELRTADVLAKKLTEWGIPIMRGMGVTGVVGVIKNGSSDRAIGLRADMDALPIRPCCWAQRIIYPCTAISMAPSMSFFNRQKKAAAVRGA